MGYYINTSKGPITFNKAELAAWRSRTTYNTWNDTFAGSPPAYTEMNARATWFIANQASELINFNVTTVDGSQRKFAYAVASAFKYLIEGDTTHGNAVKSAILTQVATAATDFTTYSDSIADPTYAKFSASWVYKMFLAYEYTLDLYSAGEKITIETWFWNAAHYYQRIHQIRYTTGPSLTGAFKKCYFDKFYTTTAIMLADNATHVSGRYYYVKATNSNWIYDGSGNQLTDYTETFEMKGDYTFTGSTTSMGVYTHINNDGSNGNLIYPEHATRNNSQGMMARVFAAVGIRTSDLYMQNAAKAYVQEWIKYCVFPDGTSGEYRRNRGSISDPPQLGTMFYNLVCIENSLIPADLFLRAGDSSLYTYTTSGGVLGSSGGSKNFALILDTLLQHIESEYDTTNAKYAYLAGKSDDSLLCEYRVSTNVRYIPEHIFLRANKYYKSATYEAVYNLQASNQVVFLSSHARPSAESYGGGPAISWGGVLGNDPCLYFQCAELEEVAERKINKRMLL